ncbi:MAG: recombinase family protein [Bacteroidota bacterium]
MEGVGRLIVGDVDRLGRDAAEVLTMVKELSSQKITLTETRHGIFVIAEWRRKSSGHHDLFYHVSLV